MALIPCRECGREISTEAAACPHCGCPAEAEPSRVEVEPPPVADLPLIKTGPRLGGRHACTMCGRLCPSDDMSFLGSAFRGRAICINCTLITLAVLAIMLAVVGVASLFSMWH